MISFQAMMPLVDIVLLFFHNNDTNTPNERHTTPSGYQPPKQTSGPKRLP
jgi:hypothetical protein